MKKIFIVLMFALTASLTAFAQDTTSVSNNITEAERIVDKYAAKVTTAVTNIVAELEEPAKEVFRITVKLKIAQGIAYMLVLVATIIYFYIFNIQYKKGNEYWKDYNQAKLNSYYYKDWSDAPNFGISMIFLILGVIFAFASVFATYWGILHLIAPEWFAIQELVELVK